jgi:hypothetical protein
MLAHKKKLLAMMAPTRLREAIMSFLGKARTAVHWLELRTLDV